MTINDQLCHIVPGKELSARIRDLQIRLKNQGLDGALVIQKADLFYYTGTTQNGWLYVPEDGDAVFMVFKSVARAKAEARLPVIPVLSPKKIPDILSQQGLGLPETLGLELDVLPAAQYLMFKEIFNTSHIQDVSFEIRSQRAVKSEFEIQCMQRAGLMADRVAEQVTQLIRPGMPEIELAGLLEAYARKLGHQGLIRMRLWDNHLFYGHIMCGAAAAVPGAFASPTAGAGLNPSIGQGPGRDVIRPNEPVLVDYVFSLDGYLADHTRIFSLGPLPDDLQKAHEAMLTIQESVRTAAVPGAVTGDLYDQMIAMADDLGYGDFFMGAFHPKIRFTAHGLGIELDEFPFIAKGQTQTLVPGMTLALEPKVVVPGKGVVGIENTWVVTDAGLDRLTRFPDAVCVV
ncbi:M24 family metallopeptidase [Desulfotignum phosphitoxidans]|jgi:Xaa-Pro aminopeptidase|uniref:Xaa-pro dipeptidase PepP n=1 Tax=Desulfotignum phosphitoxidans DSM 13687 TaxID=1286635 RepID=S0FXJ6_9BACT|nr:Xaa-Pro peptidase family protein [Desulfotignum phosphitoxidans]EMS79763.1 xaa-pro dipeptidase PepP [Desulfotignum phosphitoxidans DSM 13687]